MVEKSGLKSPGLESSWLKSLGLKGLGLKLGVEKSFNPLKLYLLLWLYIILFLTMNLFSLEINYSSLDRIETSQTIHQYCVA